MQLRAVLQAVDFCQDCGCTPAVTAAVLAAMDDAKLADLRDGLAKAVGHEPKAWRCTATICSSRWTNPRKAAGMDVGKVVKQPVGHGRPAGREG